MKRVPKPVCPNRGRCLNRLDPELKTLGTKYIRFGRYATRVRAPLVLLILTLLFYLAFLTKTYYWDGVLFSLQIEGVHRGEVPAAALFHPNHLLYSALGYLLYSAAVSCGLTMRAITVLQVFNVLTSAAASYLVYVLSKRLTGSGRIASFSWLLFACGATWWKFSTDADSYILSVLLLLLATLFLFEDSPRLVAVAVCHTLAMLFHELAIFTYVPVIAAIALDRRRSRAARFSVAIAYVAGTGLCVTAVYLLCYAQAAKHGAPPSLLRWITSYAADSGFTHSLQQIVGSYLLTFLRLFVGGKLVFLRDYFSVAICLSLCVCLAAMIWAGHLFRHPDTDAGVRPNRRAIILLWTWLLSYAMFLGSWDPGSAFHKLFVWPPIVLLIAVYVADTPMLRVRRKAFVALAVAVAAWNFGVFIYPHSHASADPVLTLAQRIDRELPKHATVYYRVLDPDDWYLEYFAPGRFWSPVHVQRGLAYMGFTNSPPGPVCFETTALELFGNDPAALAAIDPERRWDLVNSKHNIRLDCLKQPVRELPRRPDYEHRERFPR